MAKVVRTKAIEGKRPFRCQWCNNQLAVDIKGEFHLEFECRRCKCRIIIESPSPLPSALAIKGGALLSQ